MSKIINKIAEIEIPIQNLIETRILNFKDNKIEELSLDELKSTVKEEDYNGNPLMGMYHWEFIEKALGLVEKAGLNFTIDSIWAAQNQDKARPGISVIEKYREEYGDGNVQSFLLRRIFSRILINDLEDKETNTAIALSYNQMGFQLAFGPNVKICQNLAILGADKLMTTYASDNKMPNPGRIIEVLSDWLKNFHEIRLKDKQTIEAMKELLVPDHEIMEIIGELTVKRLRRENPKFPKEPLNPLNQSQIGQFTTNFLLQRAAAKTKFTAWDIYNMATELYKPGITDFPIILSSNQAMNQYLNDRYRFN